MDRTTPPQASAADSHYALSQLGAVGDRPAVLAFDSDDCRIWTYAELEHAVGALASGLVNAGLKPDGVVAMLALPSPEYIAVTLAVFRVGATIAPIDAQFADESLVHILEDARPQWLFTDERGARRIDKLHTSAKPRVTRLDLHDGPDSWKHYAADTDMEPETGKADQRAILFYTSGTTGSPKGVPLSRGNVLYQLEVARETGLIKESDRLLLPLPLHHVYPFVIGLLAPLHIGLAIVIPAALTGPQLARAIRESEASIVLGVPRLHRALVDGIRNKAESGGTIAKLAFRAMLRISLAAHTYLGWSIGRVLFGSLHRKMGGKLRMMASGGSPLDPKVAALIEAFGWDLAVGYGLTETSPLLTILSPGDRKPDTVGRVVPGTELTIDPSALTGGDDEDAAQRKTHKNAGEVLAKGPGVFGGYHHLDKETREVLDGDWFKTGDMGWFDDDGFLHLEGRVNTMLVLEGGENISPEKLEETYESACDEIGEIGILQQEGKLVGVIVPAPNVDKDNARAPIKEALQRIREKIPSYQRLTDFKISRRELPRTRLGKIRRHKLQELYLADRDDEDAQRPKEPIAIEDMSSDDQSLLDNDKAHALWELLAKRYAKHRLEPESRLESDLGIDSMEWVELSTAIEAETGLLFGDEVMETAETVHDLLEAAVGPSGTAGSDSRKAIHDPDSVLRDEDRRWIQPRTGLHKVLGYCLYAMHNALVRALFRVELIGRENLPDQTPYVLTPNHTSYLDPPALICGLRRSLAATLYWAGLTRALFGNAFMRKLSRLGQVFPIDPQRGPIASLALGAAVLKRGDPAVWFPEGQRSPDGKLMPFRPGIGLILKEYPHIPVVPVHISGAHEALPAGRAIPRPHKIIVRIGKPLMPEELEKNGNGDSPHQRIANALHDAVARLGDEDGR